MQRYDFYLTSQLANDHKTGPEGSKNEDRRRECNSRQKP
jgi:hypothetical protein